MLEFKSVQRIYPDGTRALDNISVSIQKGEFCVLLGPSGAGKSTLMSLVNGMVEATSGQVLIDKQTISRRNIKQLQRRVSMIHQQLHLVPRLSVLHNVLTGCLTQYSTFHALFKLFKTEDQRRACMLLEEVGLEEQHLYRRASELSGGQQQRVAIARAFMPGPEVVLADEPVASLDPKVSRSVLESLKEASRLHNATVLCSLHQVEYALEFADRIIALRKGRMVFDGSPSDISDKELQLIYDQNSPAEDHKKKSDAVVPMNTSTQAVA